MLFRHLATGICKRDACRAPFIPVTVGQEYHPLCEPGAQKTLTGSAWRELLAREPVDRLKGRGGVSPDAAETTTPTTGQEATSDRPAAKQQPRAEVPRRGRRAA